MFDSMGGHYVPTQVYLYQKFFLNHLTLYDALFLLEYSYLVVNDTELSNIYKSYKLSQYCFHGDKQDSKRT